MTGSDDLRRKNRRVMTATLAFVAGMVGLAYVSVPLYTMLCKVTGWGGTTQVDGTRAGPQMGTLAPRQTFAREITVRFNTDTAPNMPWQFKPDLPAVKVRVGQDALISFLAKNATTQPVTGTAVYNVTPLKAGKYFFKTQCFCFDEQLLNPGQEVHMPVSFYIDPKIMEDRELRDLKTITLSYTFFRKDSKELDKAMEKFYNTP